MKVFLPTCHRKREIGFGFALKEKGNQDQEEIGGYSEGVPPLPIPNREVKPLSADGTAKVGE